MAIQQIISAIVQGAARNMKETGQAANQAEQGGYGYGNKAQDIQYQSAPAMQSNATSPTANLTQMVIPFMSGQMQQQIPGVGAALQGEKTMLRNVSPSIGGYALSPQDVDSSRPFYNSMYMRGY